MLSKHCILLVKNSKSSFFHRALSSTNVLFYKKKKINPLIRTWNVLKGDFENLAAGFKENEIRANSHFPNHTDILVIGGGIMGTSTAYWLREKSGLRGPSITVVEKDPTFSKCSTALSVGGLRQQFSLPENIQMSLFGAEFLRTIKDRFGADADVCFTPNGYLTLASEDGAAQLLDNHKLQKSLGANNIILNKSQLKERFPWLNTEGLELGCLGIEKEGWFDPWSLLSLMKRGATDLGCRFIHGEVTEFIFTETNLGYLNQEGKGQYFGSNEVVVKLPNGEEKTITFAICIIATGSETNHMAKLAKIGSGEGILSVPIPVERRKRYVYKFACQGDPPGINTPLTIDPTGTYFRRECLGGSFICGLSPSPEEEPETNNLDVDYNFFDKAIWPILGDRVPAFNSIKCQSGWGGYYDYNYYDQNGIIGVHPYYHNFFFATGFSGHGIQQGPAVGRAIAELILHGKFQTIDLTRLGFDRLIVNKPMYEVAIV